MHLHDRDWETYRQRHLFLSTFVCTLYLLLIFQHTQHCFPVTIQRFGVASKEIFDLVSEEFANEPELLKTSLALLERNNAEYAERLEEDKAYKQMLIEKGGAVDIFPEFNTPEQTPVEVTPSRIRGPEDFQAATGQPASNFAGVNTASRLANPNLFAPTRS